MGQTSTANNVSLWHKMALPHGAADCWEWTGTVRSGYGRVHVNGRRRSAHVVVYELLNGPVPEGMQLDHLCRNRLCVNPSHLEPVSVKENVARGVSFAARYAARTHCPKGHEYTPENIDPIIQRGKNVGRRCRVCHLVQRRKDQAKRMARLRAGG
jgi:hypothetical protein